MFWLGLIVGLVIGGVGAAIYVLATTPMWFR